MFQKRHYEALAAVFADAYKATGAGDEWKTIYDHVYTPLVKFLELDNENFDPLTFSWAVASGNMPGRKVKPEHGEFARRTLFR